MALCNVGIEPADYVAAVGIPHHLEMLTARLQFLTQADVNVEADRWLRHQGVDVPAAINLAGPLIESNICTLPGSLFSFAGSRPDFFPAFVHFVHDRDAETEVDLIAWRAIALNMSCGTSRMPTVSQATKLRTQQRTLQARVCNCTNRRWIGSAAAVAVLSYSTLITSSGGSKGSGLTFGTAELSAAAWHTLTAVAAEMLAPFVFGEVSP